MNLVAITVSVGTGDQLALTLPHNATVVDRHVIVTSEADSVSRVVAELCACPCVVSNSCYDGDSAFNKGRMLTAGLDTILRGQLSDAWIVFTDADCFLPPDLKPRIGNVAPGALYFGSRRHVPAGTDRYAPEKVTDQHVSDPCGNDGPWGYFQLVNAADLATRLPHREGRPSLPDCFVSAGGIDHWLMTRWAARVRLPVTVLHLWHGTLGHRWNNGRESPDVWTWAGQSFTGEVVLAMKWPKPCLVRRTHLETLEQETVRFNGPLPVWRIPTHHGVPYEYAVKRP